MQLPGSTCVVETTHLLVFETPTSFIIQFSILVYLFSLVLDFLQNRCPNGWVSCTTSSRQPLEKVYRLLRRSILGLLKSGRQRLHHPPKSSYPDLPLTERLGTNCSGFYHVVIRTRFFGERLYPSLYLQSRKLHKYRLALKVPTTSLSFCCYT